MVSVPLYDTLGPDTVKYIANHAELAAVACSLEVLGKMLEVLAECPTVRLLVSAEGPGTGGEGVLGKERGGCRPRDGQA
jgi:long-chain acyl-CoA synthetase